MLRKIEELIFGRLQHVIDPISGNADGHETIPIKSAKGPDRLSPSGGERQQIDAVPEVELLLARRRSGDLLHPLPYLHEIPAFWQDNLLYQTPFESAGGDPLLGIAVQVYVTKLNPATRDSWASDLVDDDDVNADISSRFAQALSRMLPHLPAS